MNATQGPVHVRNVRPRDLADWPVFTVLAAFFWGCAGLLTGLYLLLNVVVASDGRSLSPALLTLAAHAGVAAVVLTAFYCAPGFRRLAWTARLALLGPLACLVPLLALCRMAKAS